MSRTLHIHEAAARVAAGLLDPLDLVNQCLERIERLDERVRAWVLVDAEGARRAARRVRDDLALRRPVGPLAGVPIGVKDVMDVAGWPTKAGSPLRADHLATTDSPLVATLRQAGAVILGKTVTVEFACFDPPPTCNPWSADLQRTPGGSSSGSAVAVALGMCLGATGTQTGGSLVRPASYCGVAAMKPTFGRISLEGTVPVAYHLDHAGAIARTAADLELLLSPVLGGEASRQEGTGRQAPPRLGLVTPFLDDADDPIRQATRTAVDRLVAAGATVEPADLAVDFPQVRAMHRRIMAVEAAAYHRDRFPRFREAFGRNIASLLEEGLAVAAVDYAEALAHQRSFSRTIGARIAPFDALVMPATNTTAPPTRATTGDPKFQSPWSYAGVPAVSLPCGLAGDGFPAALQLVARHGEDARLLRVAQWCEQALAFDDLPPLA